MINKIFHYHRSSKHNQHAFAPGPGQLDWANQPDPFRRYEGAELLPLIKIGQTEKPTFSEALKSNKVLACPLNLESVSQLFLTAWHFLPGNLFKVQNGL